MNITFTERTKAYWAGGKAHGTGEFAIAIDGVLRGLLYRSHHGMHGTRYELRTLADVEVEAPGHIVRGDETARRDDVAAVVNRGGRRHRRMTARIGGQDVPKETTWQQDAAAMIERLLAHDPKCLPTDEEIAEQRAAWRQRALDGERREAAEFAAAIGCEIRRNYAELVVPVEDCFATLGKVPS